MIAAMVAWIGTRAGAWIGAVGVILAALGGVFLSGRRAGTQAATRAALETDLSNMEARSDADTMAAAAADPADELRRRWGR